MAEPVCPPGYTCTFTPNHPKIPYDGPWWETTWGIVLAAGALIALVAILCTIAVMWRDARSVRLRAQADQRRYDQQERVRREEREHALAIEEQRTMQLDAAKGDPEMLRLVRDMQRNP
jgi:flagellar biosynthesis/type III secretory pathway M-ring protein FliF/YscJ